jgi:hypothetical protein
VTTILKLGGELLEDAAAMDVAAAAIADLRAREPVVVVHGGGRAIDADLKSRGLAPIFIDGLRVTDTPALETVVAILAGRINTTFVARLTAVGLNAVCPRSRRRLWRPRGPVRIWDTSAIHTPALPPASSPICSRSAIYRSSPVSGSPRAATCSTSTPTSSPRTWR